MNYFHSNNIKGYSDLIRVKTSALAGLGFILGMWIAYQSHKTQLDWKFIFQSILGFIGGFSLSGAMNTFNDIKDIQIDKESKPERPLPRNAVSIQNAKQFTVILLFISILVSLTLFYPILGIVILLIAIGFLYSIILQNIPVLKNLVVAFLISSPLLLSAWLVEKDNLVTNKVIMNLFFISVPAFMLFEWLKDLADVEADKKYGKRTIPTIIGVKPSAILIYLGFTFILFYFWNYLVNFQFSILILMLIALHTIILSSTLKILWEHNPASINRARKEIYGTISFTLLSLFFI
ncbi:MAG: UbiA family prenyltransferase [Candidatus Hodarchaeales archaeon]|jgi:geranylgeranylglycerol-phosphate geranylgeranyltransferase